MFYKLIKGSVLRSLVLAANVTVMFFLMPFIVKSLGDRLYGLWALMVSLTGYYFLLDTGIAQTISRYVAVAIGEKNESNINKTVSNGVALFLFLSLVSAAMTAVAILLIGAFSTSDLKTTIMILVALVGFEFSVSLPFRTYQGILRAHIDFDVISFFQIAQLAIRTVLIVVFLALDYRIVTLGVINAFSNMFIHFLEFLYVKKRYPKIKFIKNMVSKEAIFELVKFGKHIFFTQLGTLARFKINYFIVGGFLGLSAITQYQIAVRLIEYFTELMSRIIGTINPLFSQYKGARNLDAIRNAYVLSLRISTILSIFVGANILIFGKSFIKNWMGTEYTDAYYILAILTVPSVIRASQYVSYGILQSINKHSVFVWMVFFEGISNIALSLLLVHKFGLIGVSIGIAAPLLVTRLFFQPYIVSKYIGIEISYLIDQLKKPVLYPLTFFIVTYVLMNRYFPVMNFSYIDIVGLITTEAVFYFLFSFLLTLNASERQYGKHIAQRVVVMISNRKFPIRY